MQSEGEKSRQLAAIDTIDHSLESSVFANLSTVDVNQSTSIRSSRRRVKGSAVVLNTDRLQKYIQKGISNDCQDNQGLSHNGKEIAIISIHQPQTETVRMRALHCLQWWWRRHSSARIMKFTQLGVWKLQTAHRVFAVFLGFRVRKMMKLKFIQLNIKAQEDIKRILSDMCTSMQSFAGGWEHFRAELAREAVDDLLLRFPRLTHSDLTLAKSMSKQLLMERNKLHSKVFTGSIWRQFPPPGYWDIAAALHSASISANRTSQVGASPARKLSGNKNNNMETPPSVRRAVKQSTSAGNKPKPLELPMNHHNSSVKEDRRPRTVGTADLSQLPARMVRDRQSRGSQEAPEIIHLRHSNDRAERIIEPQLLSTPEHSASAAAAGANVAAHTTPRAHMSSPTAATGQLHSAHANCSSSSGVISAVSGVSSSAHKSGPAAGTTVAESSPQAKKQRDSQRGHIQLHVLSAEKLMAAKKGAPVRDSLGGAVADRIPCLKVKFSLPQWTPGAGGRNQPPPDPATLAPRKVYEKIRDFNVVTLNPQWGATFIINLPCPRNVVQSLAHNETRQSSHQHSTDDEDSTLSLSDAAYEAIIRGLLQWWSLGTVNVEVFDGERFNEEIFMGHIDILMNGFMVLIKKPEDLEIKGSFQLNKLKPSDRVSGSVKVHAFLHPPEKSCIAELLNPTTSKASAQPEFLSAGKALPAAAAHGGHHSVARALAAAAEMEDHLQEDQHQHHEESSPPTSSSSHPSNHSTSPETRNNSSSNSGGGSGGVSAPSVSFSSKFMQSLVRNSQYLLGRTPATLEEEERSEIWEPGEENSGPDSGRRGESPASAVVRTGAHLLEAERVFREPQLEETENIHFNAHTGQTVNQQDIAQSARLLKEKVRQARQQRRPRGTTAAVSSVATMPSGEKASARGDQEDSLARNMTLTGFDIQSQQKQKVAQKSRPAERKLSTSKSEATTSEHNRKEQSVESSEQRRHSMLDISKRLAGLSAVQHSTDVVLDSLNYKLEAKLRSRDAPPTATATATGAADGSRHFIPEDRMYHDFEEDTGSEDAPRDSSYLSAQEGVDDYLLHHGEEEEAEERDSAEYQDPYDAEGVNFALGLPGTAELREALQSSFRSSVEEDDAPELGAASDSDETRSYEEYGDDEDQNFHDTYDDEDEEDEDAQQHYSQLDERSPPRYQHAPPPPPPPAVISSENSGSHLHSQPRGLFEDDDNSSSGSSSDFECDIDQVASSDKAEVPVVRAVRNHTNLIARDHPQQQAFVQRSTGGQRPLQPPPPPPPPPPPLAQRTIYADDSDEPDREGTYEDNDDDEGDDGDCVGANYSTVSSVYSSNIQDFLSPDVHSRRQPAAGAPTSGGYFDAEGYIDNEEREAREGYEEFDECEVPEEPEELIVISSSGPSTYSSSGAATGAPPAAGLSPAGRTPFEVQTAADMQFQYGPSSPSRSLFETPGDRLHGPPHVPNGRNQDDSVVSSPGDIPPQCVVLELDDLEL